MTPAELAQFMKEEVPRIKKHAVEFPWKDALRSDETELLSALTAAVGLLHRCIPLVEITRSRADLAQYLGAAAGCDELLATLRLVVGEKEMP